jgi:hypothetical protein
VNKSLDDKEKSKCRRAKRSKSTHKRGTEQLKIMTKQKDNRKLRNSLLLQPCLQLQLPWVERKPKRHPL